MPLDRPEYACIRIDQIPQEFIDEYNLEQYSHNSWVYFEITKGIYSLKQAGKLANDLLTKGLSAHGYYQCATTPGLWRHKWRPILFALIVDDFGSNTWRRSTLNISSRRSVNTTTSPQIGQVPKSRASTSHGTTRHERVELQ